MNKISNEVREFILNEIKGHPSDIVSLVVKKFGFSRQRAHAYIAREVASGKIVKVGDNRWTRYFLAGGKFIEFKEKVKPTLYEDRIWSAYVKPMMLNYADNIQKICSYGFTEIFNNAIHHSEGTRIYTSIEINNNKLTITIIDNGIGIFQKIQKALNLESTRESILHLSKGKFTTDPAGHTGEGIFFTSRVFDSFSISSNDMYYTFANSEWFLSSEKREDFGKGTYIRMRLSLNSTKTLKEVMDQYSNQEIGFGKTIVAVVLSADPGDPHISRSQAKRLLIGLEKFKQIVLDFKGVESVGQAFVDEVFRVFKNEHPNILIKYFNANKNVEDMIKRGFSNLQ
ncbi:MAG: DUF4325 domain-containing protein [Candidatus Nealsonbacteria bacterium]|nr:DUF4325 domain-containing protein [Candidatus Nealsonbacteria bacterium]